MTQTIDYLKIGKASDLDGKDRKIYRILEILPGFLSISTLVALSVLSYLKPVLVAYFIIAFDVYWLLLVIYMAIFLITSYYRLKQGMKTDWIGKCSALTRGELDLSEVADDSLTKKGLKPDDVWQLIFLPTSGESVAVLSDGLQSLVDDGFRTDHMIVVLTFEERTGLVAAQERAEEMKKRFNDKFGRLFITFHPDGVVGELKGKGANQTWGAKKVEEAIIKPENFDESKLLVSVFDADTVVKPGYFSALTYKFLTIADPYHSSYQPVPVYHNNIWKAPFFSRVAATSNTFWQMIMQVREESLVTYSSHSMTWQALKEIGFWGTKNVSEDSRIFWHCLMHYNGHYRVEPIHFEISMDVTCGQNMWQTAKNLYKQQRRWAWGGENIPYLLFNAAKRWKNKEFDRGRIIGHIIIQIYGFYAWATTALIIGIIGWLPMLFGGDRFNSTVLSGNLPYVTQNLMNFAMVGLVLSAVISALLLPKKPTDYKFWKKIFMTLEWVAVPVTIVFFGSIPCLEAQIRLLLAKYMGFWVTPKVR